MVISGDISRPDYDRRRRTFVGRITLAHQGVRTGRAANSPKPCSAAMSTERASSTVNSRAPGILGIARLQSGRPDRHRRQRTVLLLRAVAKFDVGSTLVVTPFCGRPFAHHMPRRRGAPIGANLRCAVLSCAAATPSPLVGGLGWGACLGAQPCSTRRPPPPTPPHRGRGGVRGAVAA